MPQSSLHADRYRTWLKPGASDADRRRGISVAPRPPTQASARPRLEVMHARKRGRDVGLAESGFRPTKRDEARRSCHRVEITQPRDPNQLPREKRFHRFFASELESFATSVLWNAGLAGTP